MLLLPGRFSTTIGRPRLASICLPTSRARISAAEPGPNPIKTLIGWVGKVCAGIGVVIAAEVIVTPAQSATIFRVRLNIFPSSLALHSAFGFVDADGCRPYRKVFASIEEVDNTHKTRIGSQKGGRGQNGLAHDDRQRP